MTFSGFEQVLSDAGSIASFIGVIVSCFAWAAATGAKRAAKEAAEAVRTRNLAHSVSKWAGDARELLRAIRESHFENAQRAAIDLLGALSHNKGWQAGLQRQDHAAEEIVRMLNLVNMYLTDKAIFDDKVSGLAEDCQTIYRLLS